MARPLVPPGLLLPLALYLGLCAGTVHAVGWVGEVAIGGILAEAPQVQVQVDPPTDGWVKTGPLVARPTRPTESLQVGGVDIPLAINAYTGGPADWPVRLAVALGGPVVAGPVVVGLGALLLALLYRFLQFHGSEGAPFAAALWLASDWNYVFYRKVLGGTEVLLQAAALLLLWALWSRRWKGGVHGTKGIALGIGLGLLAKVTFVGSIGALLGGALLTRWDRGPLKAPSALQIRWLLGVPLVCTAPLWIAAIHHASIGILLPSHDSVDLQWQRLLSGLSGARADRETASNLLYFLGNPLGFFHAAYQTPALPPLSVLRLCSWILTVAGSALAWRDPLAPAPALLRFLSIVVPLQVFLLFFLNHDLHHLAQSSILMAAWAGMAADRLAASWVPRGSIRTVVAGVFVLPSVIAGSHHLAKTDAIVEQIRVPTFTTTGQQQLADLLRRNQVQDVVVTDYESYGMLELVAPEIRVDHAWGAVANRTRGTRILNYARGRYFLSVRASMPMIYNWDPEPDALRSTANAANLTVALVDQISCGGLTCAWLWRVGP